MSGKTFAERPAWSGDRADELEYRNPEVLASYVSNAAHVTVAPGQDAKVNLELIRLGK